MFNWFKETLHDNIPSKRTRAPEPIIKKGSELGNLPPAERFALQSGRTYRTFPDDLPESAIPTSCENCGSPYDGPTQTHCRACNQGRAAYKLDVTNEPFHTLPPKIEGEAPEVNADELIPTFGGGYVILGAKTATPCAFGNEIKIGQGSSVDQIAGNLVILDSGVDSSVIVAKNSLEVGPNFTSFDTDGGLTARKITLHWNANIEGNVILPNGGTLTMDDHCQIDCLIVGADTTITASDRIQIGTLLILGPNVKISLGEDCSIGIIESNHNFQVQTGPSFSNDSRTNLQDKYNLAVEISTLITYALDLDQ